MGKSIGFKSNDEGHRIEMPDAALTYLERVQRIPERIHGWFGPWIHGDDTAFGMKTGEPFEARVLEVEAEGAYSFKELMSVCEQMQLSLDDGDKFRMANASQMIEVLAQHGEMTRATNDNKAMLALASAVSLGTVMSIPGAFQTKGPQGNFIKLFDRRCTHEGTMWAPGDPPVAFLVVREAPILSPGTCPGCG